MDATTENSIRQEQVESFGRLMAGFSHDMKNHLGIIRESNGLISDLIAMGGAVNEQSVERLTKVTAAIEKRVIIAAEMLHHLSSFAHRPDTPLTSFQVNELITEEYTFLERFSRLQQISVRLELQEGLLAIYNEPSLLQHVLYRIYSICLSQLSAGGTLAIITGRKQKSVEILFRLGRSRPEGDDVFSASLLAAIAKLQAVLDAADNTENQWEIILTVPSLVP